MKPVPTTNSYFGNIVVDQFQWLEDMHSQATSEWLEAQNKRTTAFFSSNPKKEEVRKDFAELLQRPRYSLPQKAGDYYYLFYNNGTEQQSSLYRTKTLEADSLEVVINVNRLNNNGTSVIKNIFFNPAGTFMAYTISENGSDWEKIKVFNLKTLTHLDDLIESCKFTTISWKDEESFFYNRYDLNNGEYCNQIYLHRLQKGGKEDELIYRNTNTNYVIHPHVTKDQTYLVLHVSNGTENKSNIFINKLSALMEDFSPLFKKDSALYRFIGKHGDELFFHTTLHASRGRIIKVRLQEINQYSEVVEEASSTIVQAKLIGTFLVINYMEDAVHKLKYIDLNNGLQTDLTLPEKGTIVDFNKAANNDEMFLFFTSFVIPHTVYHVDFKTRVFTRLFSAEMEEPEESYDMKQIFFFSKDKQKVPMFIIHKKGIPLDGNNRVLMYGYGGFHISLTPTFNEFHFKWIADGGVYVLVNLRGGGEYGEDWHTQGMKNNKQKVFDDFICAAEWLIDNDYCTSNNLAIMGASNGGLLVAACANQRPDLFGAVICQVPVTDMLRYPLFTLGRFWTTEFGCATSSLEEFQTLLSYSPYHNINRNTVYPPILVTTGTHDDRVVPAHAMKYVARLQENKENDVYLRMEENVGHGIGKPISKLISEYTDTLTFVNKYLAR